MYVEGFFESRTKLDAIFSILETWNFLKSK
jgi:hypothetical protein